jgi:hypothetical protein
VTTSWHGNMIVDVSVMSVEGSTWLYRFNTRQTLDSSQSQQRGLEILFASLNTQECKWVLAICSHARTRRHSIRRETYHYHQNTLVKINCYWRKWVSERIQIVLSQRDHVFRIVAIRLIFGMASPTTAKYRAYMWRQSMFPVCNHVIRKRDLNSFWDTQ